jgi:multidrug efflux pump subunit AcrA (membrane-fusion protein)
MNKTWRLRPLLWLLPLLSLAGCLTAKEPDVEAPPPAGMAGLAVSRSNVFNMLTSPAKLEVNGAQVRTLAVTDDYSGSVPPGQVVLTVSSLSGGRYSYRFKADAGKTYHFIIAPRENITADGLAAGPGQAIETSGPFGIAAMN